MTRVSIPIALFLIGAAIGVVGGWVKPPESLKRRVAVLVLACLVAAGSVLTYLYNPLNPEPKQGPTATNSANRPTPTASTIDVAVTTAPPESGGPRTTPPITQTTRAISGSSAPKTSSINATQTPDSRNVQASRFTKFGESYGDFYYNESGTQLTFGSVPWDNGVFVYGGAMLADTYQCNGTVDFDLHVTPGSPGPGGGGGGGFGVILTGQLMNDAPVGRALYLRDVSADGATISLDSEPTPGPYGLGADSVEVANPLTQLHLTFKINGSSMWADVAGAQLGDNWGQSECGSLQVFAWGGLRAQLSNIVLS